MKRFEKYEAVLDRTDPIRQIGVVQKVLGLLVESLGPQVKIGEVCEILIPDHPQGGEILAEVVGFRDQIVQLMTYRRMDGLTPGSLVVARGEALSIPVSSGLLGRVFDCVGHPIDGFGAIDALEWYPTTEKPPDPLSRRRITERITTGIRAIDALTPVGKGQRLGIFSGSGVGKSTLLGMIARNTNADVNVIALIGERGREVREFIENDLGEEGLKRSVIIFSSSDTPPLSRVRGACVATAVAEYFRDQGKGCDAPLRFGDPIRPGPEGNRPCHGGTPGRTADFPPVFLRNFPSFWSAAEPLQGAPSPAFTPSWWRGTIWTNPWRTTSGGSSMAI